MADIGCTAALPHLFGVPGKDPNEGGRLATGKASPVIGWLRALAEHEHERCGGPGVGGVMGTVPHDDVTVAFALPRHATSAAAAVNWAL